jgi:phosphoglycolate phosphatase
LEKTTRSLDLVILDLDGTMYCSTATTVGAVEMAVRDINERHGLAIPRPSPGAIMGGVGKTREDYVTTVIPTLPRAHVDEMSDLIWHWEHELISGGKGSLFPGVLEGLEMLRDAGYLLAIATNAGTSYMHFVLDTFDLRSYFSETWCAGERGTLDKADLILGILTTLDVWPDRAVMVGDRSSDIAAAKSAGTWSIGCDWGFASSNEFGGADRVIHSFAELAPLVQTWETE